MLLLTARGGYDYGGGGEVCCRGGDLKETHKLVNCGGAYEIFVYQMDKCINCIKCEHEQAQIHLHLQIILTYIQHIYRL